MDPRDTVDRRETHHHPAQSHAVIETLWKISERFIDKEHLKVRDKSYQIHLHKTNSWTQPHRKVLTFN